MASRSGSKAMTASLMADIAVMNAQKGVMEFPAASRIPRATIETAEERQEWPGLLDRIYKQLDGPMFDSDFQITDEVREDFKEMFGSFKLESEEYKKSLRDNPDPSIKSWDRPHRWDGKTYDFTGHPQDKATDEQIREFIGYLRDELEKEASNVLDIIAREEKGESLPVYLLGRDRSSAERKEALEKLRNESEVKELIYRGQDAYEVLDAKKAAEKIKADRREDRSSGGEHYKRGVGYTGSEGDGLYHLTPHGGYAAGYASSSEQPTTGVIEGVLVSKRLLDLTPITASNHIDYSRGNRKFWDRWEKYYGKGNAPSIDHSWERSDAARPAWDDVTAFGKQKYTGKAFGVYSEKEPWSGGGANGYTMREAFGIKDAESLSKWKWSEKIAKTIGENYQRIHGKPMPENLGVPKGSDYTLQESIYNDLQKRSGLTYQLLKTPTFKRVMKEAKFDAVKYLDYGVGRTTPLGTPAYGATKPSQFKSYFGDKKVDEKSPNMFDAD